MHRFADHPLSAWALAAVAMLVAVAGARPYAGSWNDGCRLAAVESLIDSGKLAIDDSVFCAVPQRLLDSGYLPYPPGRADLIQHGTRDKLFVRGHFHSDKPAVVSLLMAGAYRPLMWAGLPRPGDRPDVFAWVMTVLTSGVGYAVAVGCMWVLGRRVGLDPRWRLAWVASFALATYAPAYTRHVNTHLPQLAVVAGMILLLLGLHDARTAGRTAWGQLAALGTLAGLGFNLDFGSGPLLVVSVFLLVAWRERRVGPVAVYTLAALPWVAAGVGLNYAISGFVLPMNMYPQHHLWAGSPFSAANMTGFLHHGAGDQALYAAAMLFGKQGFFTHNLPTLLAVLCGGWVIRRARGRAELVCLLLWCVASWGLYAVTSNNMGGACCSVRWFMPFLAPAFWLLAVTLKERPDLRTDFAALSAWGAVLGALMWWKGPWTLRMVPLLWPVVGCALLTWCAIGWRATPAPPAPASRRGFGAVVSARIRRLARRAAVRS